MFWWGMLAGAVALALLAAVGAKIVLWVWDHIDGTAEWND